MRSIFNQIRLVKFLKTIVALFFTIVFYHSAIKELLRLLYFTQDIIIEKFPIAEIYIDYLFESIRNIIDIVNRHFDLRPGAIISDLNLRRPIYSQTAAYGHFGRNDLDLPWENTDKAKIIMAFTGIRHFKH